MPSLCVLYGYIYTYRHIIRCLYDIMCVLLRLFLWWAQLLLMKVYSRSHVASFLLASLLPTTSPLGLLTLPLERFCTCAVSLECPHDSLLQFMVSTRTIVSHMDCFWKVQSGKHSDHHTGSLLVAVLFFSEWVWSFLRWNLTMQWRLIRNSLCGSGCHGILNSCLNLPSARNAGMSNHTEALPSLSLSPALFPGLQFFVFITSNIFSHLFLN